MPASSATHKEEFNLTIWAFCLLCSRIKIQPLERGLIKELHNVLLSLLKWWISLLVPKGQIHKPYKKLWKGNCERLASQRHFWYIKEKENKYLGRQINSTWGDFQRYKWEAGTQLLLNFERSSASNCPSAFENLPAQTPWLQMTPKFKEWPCPCGKQRKARAF